MEEDPRTWFIKIPILFLRVFCLDQPQCSGNSHLSSNSIWSEQEHVFSKLSGVVQLTGGKSNQPEHPSPIFATECLPLFPLAFLCNSFLSKPPCGM